MLTSLRGDIAETLEALALDLAPMPGGDIMRSIALSRGAATLRRADELEGEIERADAKDEALDTLERVRELLDEVHAKKLTPYAFRKRVAELVEWAPR